MAKTPGVWGIDIGQCALKAIRLEVIDGKVTATAFDYVEHPKILSQSDADPDALTKEALEKFLSRNPLKGDLVAMSVPGQSGLARFVKLPPVEEKKILDIVKFEAKQQIPFPLEEVVWDYQKVSEGIVTDGFAIDTEIGLFAMKRDMIQRFIGHFLNSNIEIHYVQMAPLALCNYITYDLLKRGGPDAPTDLPPPTPGKRHCSVALDVGTDGSNLIITDGARIIWQRPIPIGGNHFTRALTKELKLTFAKAEHLKRNAAKSPELANILKALKPVLTDFVGEVQRSLGYFTNTHRDAQIDYLVGLGSAFRLPGLQKYLGDKLQLEVRKPNKFERLAGEAVTSAPVFIENFLSFPVAFGLALQGLGAARLGTNLLPPEITFDRKIKAKKPWAVASVAMLMLGTVVLAMGYSIPYADANDPSIKEALSKGKDEQKNAQSVSSLIDGKQKDIVSTQTEVEAIVTGQGERMNWIELNRYVNRSLPMPGPFTEGGNMDVILGPDGRPFLQGGQTIEDPRRVLWATDQGPRAVEKFKERLTKGVDPFASIGDEDFRNSLAMVDIDSVNCRYTENLKGVYENAQKACKENVGIVFNGKDMAPDDWGTKGTDGTVAIDETNPNKPDGKGWVVELRGFTYYRTKLNGREIQPSEFIRQTLLRNLIENRRKDKGGESTIQGNVSHIFLYDVVEDKAPQGNTFKFISGSLIEGILNVEAAAGTGYPYPAGGGGAPPISIGPGAPSVGGSGTSGQPGGTWAPLTPTSSGSIVKSTTGTGGSSPATSIISPMPSIPMPMPETGTGSTVPKTPAAKIKSRYEFIVVFVWKEPTPSDKLIPTKTISLPSASGTPGMPGSMPMQPQMPR